MTQVLSFIIDKVVDAVVAVGNAVGLSPATTIAIARVAAFATPFVVSAALNAALAPSLPSPEAGKQNLKQSIPQRRRLIGKSRLSGPGFMLFESHGDRLYMVMPLCESGGSVKRFGQHWLNDDAVAVIANVVQSPGDGAYETHNQRVTFQTRTGLPTETAYASLVSERPELWNNNCRGDGIASMYVRCINGHLEDFNWQFPHGRPEPSVEVFAGAYDWRDEAQDKDDPATWAETLNPVVWLVHELRIVRGYSWETAFLPVVDILTAEADYCDEAVPLAAGGTEPRYQMGGFYDVPNAGADVLMRYLESFDGYMAERADGAVIIRAGRYDAPDVIFSDDPAGTYGNEILAYSFDHFVVDEQVVNELVVSFCSVEHAYTMIETDPWRDEDDIAERGDTRSEPLALPWVPSNGQARRLAKRKMARRGQAVRASVTVPLTGLRALTKRYIGVQISESDVLGDVTLEVVEPPQIDIANLSVTFNGMVVDANIDAWNPETEEGDGPETANRPARDARVAPEITAIEVFYSDNGTGSAGVRARLTVTGPDRADLRWFVRWRYVDGVSWNELGYSDVDPDSDIVLETGFLPANEDLEIEAACKTGSGSLSPWSDTETISTVMDATSPPAATSIGLTSWGASMALVTPAIPRAVVYVWNIYEADGTTLIATRTTGVPQFEYTKAMAVADGLRRSYVIGVAGENAAGTGGEVKSGVLTNAAPAAVTLGTVTGGTSASVGFTASSATDLAGYDLYWSTVSGFDPSTSGTRVYTGTSPFSLYGLPAMTIYFILAPIDTWSRDPALLNFTTESSFVITGSSTPPSGGGGGGGGGGFGGGGGENPN